MATWSDIFADNVTEIVDEDGCATFALDGVACTSRGVTGRR